MNILLKLLKIFGMAILACTFTTQQAASVVLSNSPLVVTSTSLVPVLPNVFLMVDDSGSMGWDYMPDDTSNFKYDFGFNSSQCNGVYYNPNITYNPPVDASGTSYPDSTFTSAWDDGFNTGSGSTNLSTSFNTSGSSAGAAFYYTYSGTQTTNAQKDYYDHKSIFYRECATSADPTSAKTTATISVGGSGSTSVTSITVNGAQILSAATAASTNTGTVASNIASAINACTSAVTGSCTVKGYSASAASGTVTISAPTADAVGATPSVTASGTMSLTPASFSGSFSSTITFGGSATYAWQPSHNYSIGDNYWVTSSGATHWYTVTSAYTSGSTYGSTDTGNSTTYQSTLGGITVNGQQILSGSVASYSSSTMASSAAAQINNCTSSISGNCTVTGYSASASGNSITITAPSAAASTYTPAASFSGPMILTSTDPFTSTIQGLGKFTKVTVSSTSGPGGTDERTNFANWYSYYRTRILMMKTSTGQAFNTLGSNYRVGFATMNNNNGNDMLNVAAFDSTQRTAWYNKLYSITTNHSTPLRATLAKVGKYYADKISSLNGVAVTDPIEFSCQQNFTILATDGFWNGSTTPTQLDNATAVGQQDGAESRPRYDGASQTTQTDTVTLTDTQKQWVSSFDRTTQWTQTVTTLGSSCSVPGSTPPNTVSSLTDNSVQIGLGLSSSNPDPGNCQQLGGSGSGTAWMCKGTPGWFWFSGSPPAVTQSQATDSTGVTWFLVDSFQNNSNKSSCVSDRSAFGSGFNRHKGSCPGAVAVSGTNVITQDQYYNQKESGTNTQVIDYHTVTTTTVLTVDGQSQPPTSSQSTSLSIVSSTDSIVSDTGAPTAGTTWTNSGGSTTVCMASPPAAGTSTPVAGTPTTTIGTQTSTTLSGPTTTQPSTYNGNPNPNTTTSSSGGTYNTLADVAEYYYMTDLRTVALGNCSSGSTTNPGNTLCAAPPTGQTTDIYNNVPSTGEDTASWQHMTTFTLGLGARGSMVFSPTYATDTSGDFYAVKNGVKANLASNTCSWQTDGTTCNWPTPVSNTQTTIDDLWHAAVDGRGTYYSATDPTSLASGISSALSGVTARTGATAAATTSNPNITSGDNFVFSSTFVTQDWYGQLVRQQLDLTTGVTLPTIDWSAQGQLDAVNASSRNIYAYSASASNHLQAFNSTNFGGDTNFSLGHISGLSQFCSASPTCLSASDQALAAGANLVNFLRGDRTNEGPLTDNTKYFRQRTHVLGDIVNAEAVYIKAANQSYADPGYSSYVASTASRQGMVYVGANDGMLHAFYADTDMMDTNGNIVASGGTSVSGGEEAWAYIPSMVMPDLYKLADKNYASQHMYYVDGTPVEGDICASNCSTSSAVWKTILVGGLNGGGQGYYAMDVTNPAAPQLLWEFTDTNMGYTFGNPQIAKLKDGTWVVMVTSGYNNDLSGDGMGHLYVLNAYTGALIRDINDGVSGGSGLARIIAQVLSPSTDPTVLEVYGGDLFGNLWRFDVNGDVGATGYDAQLLATLKGPSGVAQPITVKPEVGIVSGNTMVYVGTGEYLGTPDLTNKDPQSIYGIKDPLSTGTTPSIAIYSNPRAITYPAWAASTPYVAGDVYTNGSSLYTVTTAYTSGSTFGTLDTSNTTSQSIPTNNTFVKQSLTTTTCPVGSPTSICTSGQTVVTSTKNTVNLSTNDGWYVDFPPGTDPGTGERATTDPTLQLGTLGFVTNTPSSDSCTVGGSSTAYFFDYRNGWPISTSTTDVLGVKLGNALATRPVYVRLPNNTVVQLVRLSDGTTLTTNVPIGSGAAGTRHTSWRELISQ